MISIFSNMVKRFLEIFMDNFSVFSSSFEECLHRLTLVLVRCKEKNLVLNWKKCHFMVKQGIVLGHVISQRGIEVDKAKVDLISNLPPLRTVKDVRSFLGHTGFYRRLIQDFSKIARPLCKLLVKETPFIFYEECKQAFGVLKKILTSTPVIQPPKWGAPFEIMCDTSDYAVGAILGQCIDKLPHVIYYASQTLNDVKLNYSITEKELLAIIFALDKFRSYLLGSNRAGHGSVRAGFGLFGHPTRACRVCKFSTRDNNKNMQNRRVSGGSDRVSFVWFVGLFGSGRGR
jgi:hypothetical protein